MKYNLFRISIGMLLIILGLIGDPLPLGVKPITATFVYLFGVLIVSLGFTKK